MLMVRRVNGASMHPAIPHGKIVFALRHRRPKKGDVVIVRHHRVEVLKRVHELKEDLAYLLGDNPEESTDSRHYGWLPVSSILGVVIGASKNDQTNSAS